MYLGSGFLLIALAQVAVILTKVVLYYDTTFVQQVGRMIITSHAVSSVDIFYYIGFFLHKFLTLLGFYIIYRLPAKEKSSEDFFLAFYFIIVSAFFSTNIYYLYHLSVLILLAFIINNYCQVYIKNQAKNTLILIIAFGMLAFSNVLFFLSKLQTIYVTANIIELASYAILLTLIVRILRCEKVSKKG